MKSKTFAVRIPGFGNIGIAFDPQGEADWYPGGLSYQSHLMARHLDPKGRLIDEHDCGSGLITFVGAQALALDYQFPSVSGAKVSTLSLANNHLSGTGTNSAATSDIALQTPATVLASTLPTAGTQSMNWAATNTTTTNIYNSVCTLTYNGSAAITEWGLLTGVQNAITPPSTGTPASATTNGTPPTTPGTGTMATMTDTGSALTASSTTVKGFAMQVAVLTAATTPCYLLVANNTTHIATGPAWYKVSDGSTTTPAGTLTLAWRDVLLDRKQFAAINVVSGDSIQFTYQLTITAGG